MKTFELKASGVLLLTLFILPIALALVLACGSHSTDGDSTGGSVEITTTAVPTSVGVGGSSTVQAEVTNDGQPLANQEVIFTVSPSSSGYFVPTATTTDANGLAATVFKPTEEGAVVITANVASRGVATASLTVVSSQQAGSENIEINLGSGLLLANGIDSTAVTVTVSDDNGQPAPEGTIVKFAAGERFIDIDGNGFWSPTTDSLVFDVNNNGIWDGFGVIPSTANVVGSMGQVTVYYKSGNDAYTVYIAVTVDDNNIQGSAVASLQLSPNTTVNSIALSSDSMQVAVEGTGGIESGLISATAFDINGNPVPEGIPVEFVILSGPDGGERLDTVGYGPYLATTNGQGTATVSFHSGIRSGTVWIRAKSDVILSSATQILISAGPPEHIVVGAEACNVPFFDRVGEFVKITAVVSDVYLNPVNDSTAVYFSTDEGSMMSHIERTQEHQGIASAYWISGNNVDSADGRVVIMAETSGGTVADTGFFYNSWYTANILVSGAPASIPADGTSERTIYVTGLDANGNPVVGGTTFRASASYVSAEGGTFEDGCYASGARVLLTSKTLTKDHSLTGGTDDGIGVIDIVEYYTGLASTTFPLTITTSDAHASNSKVDGPVSVGPLETVNYTVTIQDRYGNPLGDHTINMTCPDGSVLSGTQSTNSFGEATGFRWQAPNSVGSTSLIFTDTDPRGDIVLSISVTVE